MQFCIVVCLDIRHCIMKVLNFERKTRMYILLRRNVVIDTFQIDICIFVKTFGNRMHSGARFL